jgi:hypothetical protein
LATFRFLRWEVPAVEDGIAEPLLAGLQRVDSAEFGWNAQTTAHVRPDSDGTALRSDEPSLASRTSSHSPRPIPYVLGAAPDEVVALEDHENLREVGPHEGDHACLFETSNQPAILVLDEVAPGSDAQGGHLALHIEAVLH